MSPAAPSGTGAVTDPSASDGSASDGSVSDGSVLDGAPTRLAGYLPPLVSTDAGVFADETISLAWRAPGAELRHRTWQLGDLDLVEFSSDGAVEVSPVLGPSRGAASWPGLVVGMCLEGRVTLSQDARTVQLGPGAFTFYSGGRPFRIGADGPHRWLVCRLRFVRQGTASDAAADVVAREVPTEGTAGGLLASLLLDSRRARGGMSPRAQVHCADAIHSLVRAVVVDMAPTSRRRTATSAFGRYTQWLEDRLATTATTAEALAAEHHVSVRQVRGVFAANGTTVTAFVRQRRLERLRQDLLDADLAGQTVAALARRWGLDDAAVASRLFRTQYGCPPGAYRRGGLHSALG